MKNRYYTLPPNPSEISAGSIISRMLAGIGFRFYWATDSLSESSYSYKPSEEIRSIGELIEHIWDLLNWTYSTIEAKGMVKSNADEANSLREDISELIEVLEKHFLKIDTQELSALKLLQNSFWPIINGPLSDVLVHIGQISSFRRLGGFPVSESNPFEGKPPSNK